MWAHDYRNGLALALLIWLAAWPVCAQDPRAEPLWQPAGALPQNVAAPDRWIHPPARFHAVHLSHAALRGALDGAPREFTPAAGQAPTELMLPMPDGTFARFRICESPIMAPELAAKFPEIKTYCGQGIDDPAATVRFDTTPSGLHAQILSPNGAVYVDPYRRGDARLHLSYYKRDYSRDPSGFRCLTADNGPQDFLPAGGFVPAGQIRSGNTLRTYRLAVAATGEYTLFQGGTVAAGLAAIVTAINRVDGIYETELGIRFVLVANNDLIIFTNSGGDPYSNSSPTAMLSQNQSTIDSLIGDANYDVGHVFSTGGGGLSSVAVVCLSGVKAQSVTGISTPVGDAYYVDYVAHEIGHEFGAHHTFNGSGGSCLGQKTASVAFEPGSGSTIMAYAGICGADDLQPHSDPYFHSASFDEIQNYITIGFGSDCAVATATGNAGPNVDAGPNYTIPAGTPFTLTAAGSDTNGDVLTYCWEERDLGLTQPLSAPDNGASPLFRSFSPTTNSSRTFPRLYDVLNHTTTLGEQLPSTSRTMHFRVTARDKRIGPGGVGTDDMWVTNVVSAGPFRVTSPHTNAIWSGLQTVTWDVAGTTAAPINAGTVDILLSTNGGASFPIVLAANTLNDGSETVLLPNINNLFARIKVRAAGNIFFDLSDAFTVTTFAATPQLSLDSATLVAESCTPANGALDPDEIVVVSFALRNTGTGNTTNLVATLVAGGGVVPLGTPQSYGALAAGGLAVAKSFSFLPAGSCGDTITATLQLQDGTTGLGTVTKTFNLGAVTLQTNSFRNSAAISIPSRNAASPYPSTITISGLTNPIVKATVTLTNLSHTEPDDLDILLVGPGGQSVLLMSDVGGTTSLNNVTLLFDDAAADSVPNSGPITSGTWKPTNVGVDETFSSPAPGGPYGSALSVFNGQAPNGTWSLYVYDDTNPNSGGIANGWQLTFVTQAGPFCCSNAVAPPALSISDASVIEGDSGATNALFSVSLSRPSGQPVTVNFATADGSAHAGSDYIATNGVVQFDPGRTNRTVAVAVLGDLVFETNETFAVTLASPVNATLARITGTGTIIDDEIRVLAAAWSGGAVQVQFNTLPGRTYSVERADQLSSTNAWVIVPGAGLVSGTGGLVQVLDTNAVSRPQSFYRVRWLGP